MQTILTVYVRTLVALCYIERVRGALAANRVQAFDAELRRLGYRRVEAEQAARHYAGR